MPRVALAPRFLGAGRITFAEHAYPDPGEGQLLLAVRANAICGTDRKQYQRGADVVPGHEAIGTVIEAGPGTSTAVGVTGAVYLMDYCGECRSCRLGLTNQCLDKRADMGFTHDGGYGSFELVHEHAFFPVPDEVSPIEATLLLDVMGTSGHAIRRAGLVHRDIESMYIAGAGPVGMGLLIMAKLLLGAEVPIYISDISAWRRGYAQRLGGIPIDAADPAALAAAPKVDVAVDSTGRTVARTAALHTLGKRGVLVCVGHGEDLTLDVSAELIAPERAVIGSEYFPYRDMVDNLALLREHSEYLGRVITHTFPASRVADAFDTFLAGETGKVVITHEWQP